MASGTVAGTGGEPLAHKCSGSGVRAGFVSGCCYHIAQHGWILGARRWVVRLRVDVAASLPDMPWRDVHGPARAVVYGLIKRRDPGLAAELHGSGWLRTGMRPVGISPPLFVGATARRGVDNTMGRGSVWMGSPVPQIAAALLPAAAGCGEISWGSVTLGVKGVHLESTPDHRSGEAVFTSISPVLGRHEDRLLLPDDAVVTARLGHNA